MVEYLVRLRFHVNGFIPEKLDKEYVKNQIKKISLPELEEKKLMEIMVSERGRRIVKYTSQGGRALEIKQGIST